MMTGLRSSTLASVDALRDLEGNFLAALAQSMGEISNRMESFGGNQAAAQNIVRIGTALSFLDDKADNAAETIRMVEQALQGSTEGLRSLGLPVNELTRLQQEAKESGKDIRALTAEWLAAQAEMRQGLIGEQMENEERTLAGVGRAIRDIVSEAANTQQMRDAIEALAEAFQKLLPVIEAVANFISNNLAEVI